MSSPIRTLDLTVKLEGNMHEKQLNNTDKVLLLLEDDEADVRFIKRCLRAHPYKVVSFDSITRALSFFQDNRVDIVLTDLNVIDSQQLETVDSLMEVAGTIPVIILSSTQCEDIAIKSVKRGAQNFILKDDIDMNTLHLQISFAIERAQLVTKLERAKKEAEAQSRFKSEFLAHFSHEIRTPLNAVLGGISLLEQTQLDKNQKELVKIFSNGGDRLRSIVSDILDLAKVESGKFDVVFTPVNIRNLVNECLESHASGAKEKGLLLSDFFSPEVPTYISSDPKRIMQILCNLISNAIKYTDEGMVQVKVNLESDGRLLFTIKDTGLGVNLDKQATLFSPFSQARKADMSKGTGLGLVICKKLSTLLGGTTGFHSVEGKGSEFWFTINPTERNYVNTPRAYLEDKRILVLSQNSYLLQIISEQLSSRKIKAVSMSSIPSVSYIKKYDAVIIDAKSFHKEKTQEIESHFTNIINIFNQHSSSYKNLDTPLHHDFLLQHLSTFFGDEQQKLKNLAQKNKTINQLKETKALIVDDDSVNRTVLRKMLENLNIKVQSAENGLEALSIIEKKQKFNFIFMDCNMPIMDGFEATRAIRKIGDDTIIIALTAHAYQSDKQDCLNAGMDYFLAKPIKIDDIQKVITEFTIKKAS